MNECEFSARDTIHNFNTEIIIIVLWVCLFNNKTKWGPWYGYLLLFKFNSEFKEVFVYILLIKIRIEPARKKMFKKKGL